MQLHSTVRSQGQHHHHVYCQTHAILGNSPHRTSSILFLFYFFQHWCTVHASELVAPRQPQPLPGSALGVGAIIRIMCRKVGCTSCGKVGQPQNLAACPFVFFFQNGAKSGFEMCFGPSTLGAGTLGAGTKTRFESRLKKSLPHCNCRPRGRAAALILTGACKDHGTVAYARIGRNTRRVPRSKQLD